MSQEISEKEILKNRATTLGIKFHPNIGVDKLREKVNAAMNDEVVVEEEAEVVVVSTAKQATVENPGEVPVETKAQMHNRLRKQASKLVRIRISCMNPNKKDWEGEVFTVSNSVIGTFKKYVPFDNDEGWHVPQVILNMIKERECQIFQTKKNERGVKMRVSKIIREFAVEILDPLTSDDLKDLATKQAMANNLN